MSQEPERSNFPEILALREQGLSFAEISECTGETREAIRQRIARFQSSSVNAPTFLTSRQRRPGINTSATPTPTPTPTRSRDMYQPPTKTPQQITSTQLAQLKTKVRLPEKDIIAMAL